MSPLESNSSRLSRPSSLLQRVVSKTDQCYCEVWVDTNCIGKSSIQFVGLISIGNDVLASVRRVFVRMSNTDSNTEGSGKKLKSAPFSDEEKRRFREEFGVEALGISENYKASDMKKIRDPIPIKRPDLNSDSLKNRFKELELSSSLLSSSYIMKVNVGPQHVNFGKHADHAFLAETAFHALTISANHSGDYVAVQYISEVLLGDDLESYAHRLDDEAGGVESVILVATRKATRERNVVLIAQGE